MVQLPIGSGSLTGGGGGGGCCCGDKHLFWGRWVKGSVWIPPQHSGALSTPCNSTPLDSGCPGVHPHEAAGTPIGLETPHPLIALSLNFTSRLLVLFLSMDRCSNVLMGLGNTNKNEDHFCPRGLTVLVGSSDVHVKEAAKQSGTLQLAWPFP